MSGALLEYAATTAWAMEPGLLEQLGLIVQRHSSGDRLSAAEVSAITGGQADRNALAAGQVLTVDDGLAILPISGIIARHSSLVNGSSQPKGTGLDAIRSGLRQALASAEARAILLAIDSPGGSSVGVADLADEIAAASKSKPVFAYTAGMAASAAYWLASGAREIWLARDALAGSVGIYSLLMDSSRRAANSGLDVQIIRSGPHKGAFAPGVPVADIHVAEVEKTIQAAFADFLAAVGTGRKLTGKALSAVADGRLFRGADAVGAGLADAVMTLDAALAAARAGGTRRAGKATAKAARPPAAASSSAGSGSAGSGGYVPRSQQQIIESMRRRREELDHAAAARAASRVATDSERAERYAARVAEIQAGGAKGSAAHSQAAKESPADHAAWIRHVNEQAEACAAGGRRR